MTGILCWIRIFSVEGAYLKFPIPRIFVSFKGVHTKMKILSLFTLMLFQLGTYFLLLTVQYFLVIFIHFEAVFIFWEYWHESISGIPVFEFLWWIYGSFQSCGHRTVKPCSSDTIYPLVLPISGRAFNKHTSQWRFLIRHICTMLLDSTALKQLLFPIIDCLTSCNNKQSNRSGWNIGGYQGFLFSFSHAVFV